MDNLFSFDFTCFFQPEALPYFFSSQFQTYFK